MNAIRLVSESRCFGGMQRTYEHYSGCCACTMRFAAFLPGGSAGVPALYWLSGLTCTEENFIVKAGAQRIAAELGIALIVPDTSPRGVNLPGEDDEMDVGSGAGFYVNATRPPWAAHYRMYDYVTKELVELVNTHLPVDPERKSISGHSMGGHGALLVGTRRAAEYRSVSAFAPICAVSRSVWGSNALAHYLGEDQRAWREYDVSEVIRQQPSAHTLLVDQGGSDPFLEHLRPDDLRAACDASGQPLRYAERPGYDHSFFFVSSFMERHLRFHALALGQEPSTHR